MQLVFEMSQTESLNVSLESFQRAAAWLQKLESIVFTLAEAEFSGDALRLHRKENFFRAAGTTGVRPADYHRKYRGERPSPRRKEDLATLLEMKAIYKIVPRVGTSGALLENLPRFAAGDTPKAYTSDFPLIALGTGSFLTLKGNATATGRACSV
jgi:hypothetical protein